LTAPASTASRKPGEQHARLVGDYALGVLGERNGAEAVDDGDRPGAVLAEHAVEVIAGRDLQVVLGHPERAGRGPQLGRLVDGRAGAAPDSSATAPVATARRRPSRASKNVSTRTVWGAAPASTHARSASRASASASPLPLECRAISAARATARADRGEDLGVLGAHVRAAEAAGDLGRERGARAAERDDGDVGPEVVRSRGVGDGVGDLLDRAVEQRAGGLSGARFIRRASGANAASAAHGRARPPRATGRRASARRRPRRRPARRRRRGRARGRRTSR
jgi:hypothetical protein